MAVHRHSTDTVPQADRRFSDRQLLDALFTHSAHAVFVTGRDRRIVEVNPAFETLFGYRAAEIRGWTITALHGQADHPRASLTDAGGTRTADGSPRAVVNYCDAAGRTFLGETDATTIPGDGGRGSGCVVTIRELRDDRRSRAELMPAKEHAAQQSRRHFEFLTRTSHEIRTPLNGMVGMLEALQETASDQKQREMLEAVSSASRDLVSVIDNIHELSKIEEREALAETEPFDARQTVLQRVDLVRSRAEGKGLEIGVVIDENVPDLVTGDSRYFGLVLDTLLTNAVMHTDEGQVSVLAHLMNEPSGRHIAVIVRDNGAGVAKGRGATLFDAYTQLYAMNGTSGVSFSLNFAKQLVEAMGGQMGIDATLDRGSAAWFSVPIEVMRGDAGTTGPVPARARPERADVGSDANERCRVLLAEDHPINVKVVQAFLPDERFDLTCVPTGAEALKMARSATFDVILMDINMPDMDGLEATRRIRSLDHENAGIPIVGITAHALADTLARCTSAGMDDVITKPFSKVSLELAVTKARRERRPTDPAALSALI